MNTQITSIQYPFAIDRGLGALAEESNYAEHVEQLIKQVLFTNPGERINRPDFGCGLRQMVFAPNSDATANLAKVTVQQALEKWLNSVLEVNGIKVNAIEETMEIRIIYTLKAKGERRFLNVEIT